MSDGNDCCWRCEHVDVTHLDEDHHVSRGQLTCDSRGAGTNSYISAWNNCPWCGEEL